LAYTLKEDIHGSHATILRILKRYPRGKVLEVGCADGFFSEKIAAFHEVWGVELDKTHAKEAENFCRKVFVGDIEDMEIEEKFDIILMADVLEHTKNPASVLKKVGGWLAESGIIILSVPNMAHFSVRLSLLGGRFDYAERGILDKTHLKFFTKSSIENLLDETGYIIVERDITPLPMLEILGVKRNRMLDCVESLNYHLSRIWKTLFAYQFIIIAERGATPSRPNV
jgi:2-polyprenyl-3-methyl-5-hydroxy-6-metoxy-1,4-benzoquinol methylase